MVKATGIVGDWALNKLTPEKIEEQTTELITNTLKVYEEVGALKPEDCTFEKCIKPLIDVECYFSNTENPLTFGHHCASDKNIRDAALSAQKRLNDHEVEMSMRVDVFKNVAAFKEKYGLDGLTAEQKRFVEKEITLGRRNGLHLDEDKRNEIKTLKKKISELGTKFGSNLNEDTSHLYFTAEELAGVPEDLINSFEKGEDNRLKVTMKYPHFFPVTRKCRVPETRRTMETTYQSRCINENTPILEELICLRQQHANLLGYENHAAYIQELRMAKNPENVKKFLSELAVKMQPIWLKEKEEMIALKKEECEKYGYSFNDQLDFWDFRYYMTMIEEKKYAVDQEKLKEYFPLSTVTTGLLDIYQDLLSLKFNKVENADTWHEEVALYEVQDSTSKETIGYFFLDLHPRDGKYGHAAIFHLQPSCINEKGERQVAACAMMANFSRPTEDKPALLDHGEVETYFHEFGHVMHMICAQTETARFTGTHVERDFVEAPSQMLENWVWKEEPLRKMSGHYKDQSPIPNELLDKLMAARKANAGGFNLRQIILGTFDQKIHTCGKADTMQVFSDTYNEIIGLRPIPNTNMPANFGHMVGYDAQYYGYLWSEVFSFDMFETRFEKEGLMNPSVGVDYRNKILKPGGSKDAIDLLRDFLGREPNQEAFLRSKGLEVEMETKAAE